MTVNDESSSRILVVELPPEVTSQTLKFLDTNNTANHSVANRLMSEYQNHFFIDQVNDMFPDEDILPVWGKIYEFLQLRNLFSDNRSGLHGLIMGIDGEPIFTLFEFQADDFNPSAGLS